MSNDPILASIHQLKNKNIQFITSYELKKKELDELIELIASKIKAQARVLYQLIQDKQIELFDQLTQYENETISKLEHLLEKEKETDVKINKYECIYKSYQLDSTNEDRILNKFNNLNAILDFQIDKLDTIGINLDFEASDDLSIGEINSIVAELDEIKNSNLEINEPSIKNDTMFSFHIKEEPFTNDTEAKFQVATNQSNKMISNEEDTLKFTLKLNQKYYNKEIWQRKLKKNGPIFISKLVSNELEEYKRLRHLMQRSVKEKYFLSIQPARVSVVNSKMIKFHMRCSQRNKCKSKWQIFLKTNDELEFYCNFECKHKYKI